jgi:hypothetical protein
VDLALPLVGLFGVVVGAIIGRLGIGDRIRHEREMRANEEKIRVANELHDNVDDAYGQLSSLISAEIYHLSEGRLTTQGLDRIVHLLSRSVALSRQLGDKELRRATEDFRVVGYQVVRDLRERPDELRAIGDDFNLSSPVHQNQEKLGFAMEAVETHIGRIKGIVEQTMKVKRTRLKELFQGKQS